MSLLDDGPDTVVFFPEVRSTDDRGNVTAGPGLASVSVQGRMQPISAARSANAAERPFTTYRFQARDVPAGAYATAQWGGRSWDVIGEPERHTGSDRTRHVTVILRTSQPLTSFT